MAIARTQPLLMQHEDDSSSDEDTLQRCLSAPSAIVLRDRLVRHDGGSVLLGQVGKIMRRAHELHRTNNSEKCMAEVVVRGLKIAVKLASRNADAALDEQVCALTLGAAWRCAGPRARRSAVGQSRLVVTAAPRCVSRCKSGWTLPCCEICWSAVPARCSWIWMTTTSL